MQKAPRKSSNHQALLDDSIKAVGFENFVRAAMQTGKAPPAPKKAKLGKIARAKPKGGRK